MSGLPIAHAGHWLVNVLYIVPLLVVVAMLGISSVRDRRAEAAEAAGASPASDPPVDESAAP
jgi:ABC-type proline/glycine betaine transport system permease subunit